MHSPFDSVAKVLAWAVLGALTILAPLYLWQETGWSSSIQYDGVIWTSGAALTGFVLFMLMRRQAHAAMLAIMLGWLGMGVGIGNLLIVCLWFISAWALGGLLLQYIHKERDYALLHPLEATVLGAAIWLGAWNLMLHYRVNYRGIYWGLTLIALAPALRFRADQYRLAFGARLGAAGEWMKSIPFVAWVLGLAIIGWVLRWSSIPSVMFDDHAMHLRLWTSFVTQHRAELDPTYQIWSLAPFALDLTHAALSLMAGTDMRSAWNLGLALSLLGLTARVLQQARVSAPAQWLLVVLLATTPMLGNLLLSLQTELVLAVIAMACVSLISGATKGHSAHVWGVLAGAALCAAVKLPAAALGVLLIVALVLRVGLRGVLPQRKGALWAALALLILGWVALHNYAFAWRVTGNPVFPLYNGIFRSPYYSPENFIDTAWTRGFTLSNYVNAFFETSRFFESKDYVAGWQYLFLLPFAIVALALRGAPRSLRLALIPLLGFGTIMFAAIQYWRYLFPVMPLAVAVMGALFVGQRRYLRAVFAVLALACIAMNLYSFRGISWIMQNTAQTAYTEAGRERLVNLYAPAVKLNKKIAQIAPGARVLYPMETTYGAALHGTPLYVNWYTPARTAAYRAMKTEADVANFLAAEKVDFIIVNQGDAETRVYPWISVTLLREYLARYGKVIDQSGPLTLYRVGAEPVNYHDGFSLDAAQATPSPGVARNSAGEIEATSQAISLPTFTTGAASQARYTVRLRCATDKGSFIAQVNWDSGDPYYRLVACHAGSLTFSEALFVPTNARLGQPYITIRDGASVVVEDLHVELN